MAAMAFTFPRAAAAFGRKSFPDMLEQELHAQAGQIALENFCQEAGLPDEESVEFTIDWWKASPDGIQVRVSCSFNEEVPTSCGAISFPRAASGSFQLTIDTDVGAADIDYEIE